MIESFKEMVRGIRNIRMEMNVPAATKTDLYIVGRDAQSASEFGAVLDSMKGIGRMLFAKGIEVRATVEGIASDAATVVTGRATAYIPLDELVDKEKEIQRLSAESAKMDREIARAEGMLNNPNFVNKAPAAKVEAERGKLERYRSIKKQIEEQLKRYR